MIVRNSSWLYLYYSSDDVEVVRRQMVVSIVVDKTIGQLQKCLCACLPASTHARHYYVIIIARMEMISPVFFLDYYVRSLVNIECHVV